MPKILKVFARTDSMQGRFAEAYFNKLGGIIIRGWGAFLYIMFMYALWVFSSSTRYTRYIQETFSIKHFNLYKYTILMWSKLLKAFREEVGVDSRCWTAARNWVWAQTRAEYTAAAAASVRSILSLQRCPIHSIRGRLMITSPTVHQVWRFNY